MDAGRALAVVVLAGAGLAARAAVGLVSPRSAVVARLLAAAGLEAGDFGAAVVVAALFGLAVGLTETLVRLDAVPVVAGVLAALVGVAGLRGVLAAGEARRADTGLADAGWADAALGAAVFADADRGDPARSLDAVFEDFGAVCTAGADAGVTLLARLLALAVTSSWAGASCTTAASSPEAGPTLSTGAWR